MNSYSSRLLVLIKVSGTLGLESSSFRKIRALGNDALTIWVTSLLKKRFVWAPNGLLPHIQQFQEKMLDYFSGTLSELLVLLFISSTLMLFTFVTTLFEFFRKTKQTRTFQQFHIGFRKLYYLHAVPPLLLQSTRFTTTVGMKRLGTSVGVGSWREDSWNRHTVSWYISAK